MDYRGSNSHLRPPIVETSIPYDLWLQHQQARFEDIIDITQDNVNWFAVRTDSGILVMAVNNNNPDTPVYDVFAVMLEDQKGVHRALDVFKLMPEHAKRIIDTVVLHLVGHYTIAGDSFDPRSGQLIGNYQESLDICQLQSMMDRIELTPVFLAHPDQFGAANIARMQLTVIKENPFGNKLSEE